MFAICLDWEFYNNYPTGRIVTGIDILGVHGKQSPRTVESETQKELGIFLKASEMWDMPLDPIEKKPGERRIPRWFGNVAYVIAAAILKVAFRYSVKNRENLRAFKGKSSAILVCNHTSYLDVAFIYLAGRPSQWIRIIGRETLFRHAHGLLGQIFSRVGAIPIKRDAPDKVAIKRSVRMLKQGELVEIMPEGTRRDKGNKKPTLHPGAAFIARMAGGVPILPMAVRGVDKIKQKGQRLHFPKVTVIFGTPVLLADFNFLPKEQRLEACTWYAMRQCFAMHLDKPPEEVDMVALFPDTQDYSDVFREHPIPQHSSEEVAGSIGSRTAEPGK